MKQEASGVSNALAPLGTLFGAQFVLLGFADGVGSRKAKGTAGCCSSKISNRSSLGPPATCMG